MIRHVQNPCLEAHNLTVSYNRKPVLWNIDFTLPQGHLIGVIGPNGSGKTTLLKALMGLIQPASGYVKVFGEDLNKVRHRVSYVPQRESVDWDFPASALDVVMMGRYKPANIFKGLSNSDKQKALESLERVGMSDFAQRQISQLSGGQQQRVFIARSLAQDADLYIMDEPFVGVDAATESSILDLLSSMNEAGKTVIVVHHDLETAKQYFDWIVLLNTRLVASGNKDEIFIPGLLQEAYGGKLTLLNRITELVQQEEFPVREKKNG